MQPTEVQVVNVGLALFADAVRDQGRPVEQVDWRVPGAGDPALVAALTRLYGTGSERVERANAEVVRRLDSGVALLSDIAPAIEVVPDIDDRTILHCGPAIEWAQMCDPLRRSVRAAVVAEGWAEDVESGDRVLAGGEVRLTPANRHAMVVPMASAIGPTAPVYIVEGPMTAFAPIGQGSGEVAWFGRETPAAIERLRFLRDVVAPSLRDVIRRAGPLDVFSLAAQGLQMGDDVHLRTQASTNLLIRTLLPHLVEVGGGALARFLSGNHLFFLTMVMAAAKSLVLWAEQVPDSSIVTTMSRNGTTFGVRLAGSERLSVTEAPPVRDALYQPGQGPKASARDIGDSAVLELIGLGGAASGGSPAVAAFVGGTMRDARAVTDQMALICAGQSSRFTLPTMDSRGTPLGVDVRRCVELGITPRMNTGILHVSDGSLRDVIRRAGPLDVFSLAAQGLQMGDDVHLRTQASTNLLIRTLLPHLVEVGGGALARFLSGNHLFFLTMVMAAAKSLVLWAEQVPDSSIVTTMSRNGTTFGVRLAGSERLSVTEAPPVRDALYQPGQGPKASARDIGDSAVLELIGLGGAASGGSPAVAAFVGGTMRDARAVTDQMALICAGQSSRFTLPTMDSRGTPLGVDVRRCVELGITPRMNTGILHVSDGSGQVGAGVATAPRACFIDALLDLDRRLGTPA